MRPNPEKVGSHPGRGGGGVSEERSRDPYTPGSMGINPLTKRQIMYLLRTRSAAEYLDMTEEEFIKTIAPHIGGIQINGQAYYLKEDIEMAINLMIRYLPDNVTELHAS